MALSDSLSSNFYSNLLTLSIEWSATQNVSKNTSTVTAIMYLKSNHSLTTIRSSSTKSGWIKIDGTTYSISFNTSISGNQKKEIGRATKTVTHASNGAKSLTVEGSASINIQMSGGWIGTQKVGPKTTTLNTIPRASSISLSASSVNYGSAVTISISRASSSFTHTLRYNWNGTTGTIVSKTTGTSQSWTVPLSLMNNIPNQTSSSGTIYCDTYSGSTKIGEGSIKLTTTVPSSVVPTFTSVTHSEAVSSVTSIVGSYTQNLSRVQMTINGASGTYGSSIRSYRITFDGTNYSSRVSTSNPIKGSGTMTMTATVTDSRGRTSSSKSATITVLPYSPPKISLFDIKRANSNGVTHLTGNYVRVDRRGSFSALSGKNPVVVTVRSRVTGTTAWTTKETVTYSTGTAIDKVFTIGTYDIATSYDFELEAKDKFNTTLSTGVIAVGEATMSWSRDGVGIGKIHERGILDARGDAYVEGFLSIDGVGQGGPLDEGSLRVVGSGKAVKLAYGSTIPGKSDHAYIEWNRDGLRDGYIGFGNDSSDFFAIVNNRGSTTGAFYLGPQNFNIRNETATLNGTPVFSSEHPELWSGAIYLRDNQNVTPTRTLSQCPNGWVLLWSHYPTADQDFNITFIHKTFAEQFSGKGMWHILRGANGNDIYKYLYVYNHRLTGIPANQNSPNNSQVLRKVYAW